jgi:hypothetical protein
MRKSAQFIATPILGLMVLAAVAGQTTDSNAVLAGARAALGGEKRLSAVRSFVATGQTRQVRGDNLVPIEFEISVELPDKYVRRDEIPAQESGPTSIGFSGASLIQVPVPPLPVARAGGPPPPSPAQLEAGRAARALGVKQDFARLMLGMFAASFAGYPLTFTYIGEAEAPQGRADVIEVKGSGPAAPIVTPGRGPAPPSAPTPEPGRGSDGARGVEPGRGGDSARGADGGRGPEAGRGPGRGPGGPPANFTLRLFVYKETHLPIMVSWDAPVQGKPVEQRLYYADYRDVDGMKFPFRLRRASGADTTEETTFDRFRINAKIDPNKFEAR